MITMEMLGRIRRMHLRDKVSLHEIAKRTGLSRNTVRSWLREPGEVQEPVYSRAPVFNKLSGFAAELERSLTADAQRAEQNRRTARALFTQIKLSDYAGGYTRVTDFIRVWRSDAGKGVTAFVPLRFDLGEAFQFDWSEEGYIGRTRKNHTTKLIAGFLVPVRALLVAWGGITFALLPGIPEIYQKSYCISYCRLRPKLRNFSPSGPSTRHT